MHGLINRTIQCFVTDTYSASRWVEIAGMADVEPAEFEAMLHYEDAVTDRVLTALSMRQNVPRETVLEDIGTYLVSHPKAGSARRLLRFGGVDYVEFLHSLDDLPDRVRLAVADLHLPELELREHGVNRFSLVCRSPHEGFGHVLVGILRALADDYGALVILDHLGRRQDVETIEITLIEAAFAAGREFELGARAG